MKKPKQPDKSTPRMLPPLEHITLDDWAKICDKVDAKYRGEKHNNLGLEEEATR
jgi:hypothetical protein